MTFVEIAQQVACGGIGRSEAGELHYLLKIGRGSAALVQAVPAAQLAARNGAFFEWLAKAGAPQLKSESKNRLQAALEDCARGKPSFSVVAKTGWAAGMESFAHPSGLIGDVGKNIEFTPSEKQAQHHEKFRVLGTARNWRDGAGELHCSNSLGITLAAAALASPLLLPMAEENFALCVVGAPEAGKSSWLVAASSQWGAHSGADRARQLGAGEIANHTIASLEELFVAHNDLGLVLDDLRGLRGPGSPVDVIEQLAFLLSDGAERGRQTSVDAPERFRLVLLTSANQSAQAKAAASHRAVDRAILDRLIEIPLPFEHCAVEEFHGHRNLGEFCERLKSRSLRCAGATGFQFVRKLHAWLAEDRDGCVAYLKRGQRMFIKQNEDSGGRKRVLRRFGIIYAAGCLAIKFGLHPWDREELASALAASLVGHIRLTTAQTSGALAGSKVEIGKLLAILRDWFLQKRFEMRDVSANPIDEASEAGHTVPAYLYVHRRNGPEVLLKEEAFARLVRCVCNPVEAKRLLLSAGVILGDAARTSVKRTIGRKSNGELVRFNVIALKRSAIDPAEDRI